MAGSFESWLNLLLRELNTDETVFCSYITGILEGDEPLEEKSEALEGILNEIIVSKIICFLEWCNWQFDNKLINYRKLTYRKCWRKF